MKAKLINIIFLIIGIIIAVTATNLLQKKETEPTKEEAPEIKEKTAKSSKPSVPKVLKKTEPEVIEELEEEVAEPSSNLEEKSQYLQELLGKIFNGSASEEEQLAFWEALRNTDEIKGIIDLQKEKVDADPGNVQGHMDLASLYVAKIWSVPAGPEKGLWGEKAINEWQDVLEIEPEHWDARYSVALSYSMYPDFLNMSGKAISEFETLVEQQRDRTAEPKFSQTYAQLSRLYLKRGDKAYAKDTLEEGLEMFPDDEQLREQYNSLSSLQ